ncbi:MAG: Peptidoglycan D,D-transpeptidase MrdA [Candidatus Scalindua arabica]|uniref:Peptidoglycan D,D-transpeptidase MrdA n=1 Tax=Candidatus Scalindua arabica TaxID=1127984 RepID=A0A942A5C5_9BACT|nr:Peptidoglycan D,D-transpeptidase MrdA [Candidatus Scalindua arabica]
MYKSRFKIFFGIIIVSFFVILCKLFYVQIIEGGKFSGMSDSRRIRTVSIDTLRGTIYDRNGSVLAIDKHSFELTVPYAKLFNAFLCIKQNILPEVSVGKDKKITHNLCRKCHSDNVSWIERVAETLEISYADILEKTTNIVERVEKIKRVVEMKSEREIRIKEETVPHSLLSDLSWEDTAKFQVRLMDLPGIQIGGKPVRWYPGGDSASHIIGYVGKLDEKEIRAYNFKKRWFENLEESEEPESEYFVQKAISMNSLVGKSGIEKTYNSRLMGVPGEKFEEITLDTMRVDKLILERPSIPGNNIILTIDDRIQGVAENALGERKGSVVVMDPWSGEVLAMAAFPRYNLNTLNEDYSTLSKNPQKPFLNRPIQSVLPPGSVFKIVTAIAALEENKIDENTQFACYGSLKVGGSRFRCFSEYGHGLLNVEEAIQYSCNVFFFEVAKVLGGSLLKKWADKFGLGNTTNIDLAYEKKGNMPASKSMSQTVNLSIGQGAMLVTPIQATKMIAMVANGGWCINPYILQKLTTYNGKMIMDNEHTSAERIDVSEENMDVIKRSLRRVVTSGTAKKTGLGELRVAGKTGTTQTARDDINHAWFVGYAPFKNPKYCFTVAIEHTAGHGAEVAGPVVENLLTQLGL